MLCFFNMFISGTKHSIFQRTTLNMVSLAGTHYNSIEPFSQICIFLSTEGQTAKFKGFKLALISVKK